LQQPPQYSADLREQQTQAGQYESQTQITYSINIPHAEVASEIQEAKVIMETSPQPSDPPVPHSHAAGQ
jgi:hypothetical protein